MLVAKNLNELERKLQTLKIPYKRIIETETYYWIESEKHGFMKAFKPRTKEEIEEILKKGAFPPKYIKSVLYGERLKTEALNKALKVKKKGIIQEGKAGVGKTYALTFKIAVLLRYYHLNAPLYVPLQAFDIQSYRTVYPEYDSYLLDDLNPNLTEWELDFVREIIYHAYNHDKRLFITTNTDIRTLLGKFIKEEPVISRLLETCEIQRINERKDLRALKV